MSQIDSRIPKTSAWLHGRLVCCQNADMARAQLSHPTMQQLRCAIEIIGVAMRDYHWVTDHDPKGKLKEILRNLVEITSLSRQ